MLLIRLIYNFIISFLSSRQIQRAHIHFATSPLNFIRINPVVRTRCLMDNKNWQPAKTHDVRDVLNLPLAKLFFADG